MNKWINKFKYKKVKQNKLNRQNAWLVLINWLLNCIVKLIAGTNINDIEKLVFWTWESHKLLNLFSSFFWYRLDALVDIDLNECSP